MATTDIDRRRFIKMGALAVTTIICPTPLMAAVDALLTNERRLSFHNLHTNEKINLCYFREGEYDLEALSRIDYILRDHRTGAVEPIAPQLLEILFLISCQLATSSPFHVISGYRSPSTNVQLKNKSAHVASRSLHMQGMAADIRIPDVPLSAIRQVALGLRAGGVGYYPGPDFVHIDAGAVRSW